MLNAESSARKDFVLEFAGAWLTFRGFAPNLSLHENILTISHTHNKIQFVSGMIKNGAGEEPALLMQKLDKAKIDQRQYDITVIYQGEAAQAEPHRLIISQSKAGLVVSRA